MASNPTPAPSPAPIFSPDLSELIGLAQDAAGITIVDIRAPDSAPGIPSTIPVGIKHGERPEVIDLSRHFEAWRFVPQFRRGTAKALTLQSFIDLTNYHKVERSAVFADTNWQAPSFTAVIDYHDKPTDAPDFGKHRVAYQFPLSPEWVAWTKQDGQKMNQADFAAFLEDHIPELASPSDAERVFEDTFQTKVATPAELMQLSRGLQVNIEARVKNVSTLQTGEGQIQWEEAHKDADGKPLKVPGLFVLAIAPFFMGEKIRIPVRLRYRASGGTVIWFFQIYRPDQFVTERVRDDLDTVARETGLPVYEGAPEMSGTEGR